MKRKVIALTGYIGSGKSCVARILRQWGYKTVDCDAIARQIADEPHVIAAIGELLGDEYVRDGRLDRSAIRQRVFADSELLDKYQSLFFDKVRVRLQQIVAETDGTLFVEIPVLDAFRFDWSEVWRVECSRDEILRRVAARDGVNAESIAATLSAQKPCSTPDRIITNNGTLAELEQTVDAALRSAGLRD